MAENLKKGDILISSSMFSPGPREERTLVIYNGIGKENKAMINITYVFDHAVYKNDDNWSHFYEKANEEDIKRFHQRLDKLGYFYDAETGDVVKKDITDKAELKERLKKYMTNYDRDHDERVCLLRAIENLI